MIVISILIAVIVLASIVAIFVRIEGREDENKLGADKDNLSADDFEIIE